MTYVCYGVFTSTYICPSLYALLIPVLGFAGLYYYIKSCKSKLSMVLNVMVLYLLSLCSFSDIVVMYQNFSIGYFPDHFSPLMYGPGGLFFGTLALGVAEAMTVLFIAHIFEIKRVGESMAKGAVVVSVDPQKEKEELKVLKDTKVQKWCPFEVDDVDGFTMLCLFIIHMAFMAYSMVFVCSSKYSLYVPFMGLSGILYYWASNYSYRSVVYNLVVLELLVICLFIDSSISFANLISQTYNDYASMTFKLSVVFLYYFGLSVMAKTLMSMFVIQLMYPDRKLTAWDHFTNIVCLMSVVALVCHCYFSYTGFNQMDQCELQFLNVLAKGTKKSIRQMLNAK
ncbi:unnamed protein product [Bursaphelenchus okinawaensis]|uniref:Uncharacterized protein n=1 Tax=Bursaphelenchus okinawaensis TaxID=465554 RepID=A0A811JW72_9BILA|nr:unnamed protein product [Bursaphelenchus okinawaensis]CAG9086008.1 unnamed protein product [Bursaphelenchus okinawaensis]